MQEKQVTKSKEQTRKEMTDMTTRFSEILFKLNESYGLFSQFDRSLNGVCGFYRDSFLECVEKEMKEVSKEIELENWRSDSVFKQKLFMWVNIIDLLKQNITEELGRIKQRVQYTLDVLSVMGGTIKKGEEK